MWRMRPSDVNRTAWAMIESADDALAKSRLREKAAKMTLAPYKMDEQL